MADVSKSIGAVIGIVTAIGVSVLVIILFSSLTAKTYDTVEDDLDIIGYNYVTEEAFTADNLTARALAHGDIHLGTIRVANATKTDTVYSANNVNGGNLTFVLNYGTVLLTPTIANIWNGTTMYINYTWGRAEIGSSAKSAMYGGFLAQEQLGDYLPIIVLSVIMFLVLTIVLGFTGFGGGGEKTTSAL